MGGDGQGLTRGLAGPDGGVLQGPHPGAPPRRHPHNLSPRTPAWSPDRRAAGRAGRSPYPEARPRAGVRARGCPCSPRPGVPSAFVPRTGSLWALASIRPDKAGREAGRAGPGAAGLVLPVLTVAGGRWEELRGGRCHGCCRSCGSVTPREADRLLAPARTAPRWGRRAPSSDGTVLRGPRPLCPAPALVPLLTAFF